MARKSIGTIIVGEDNSPNPSEFSFVLTKPEEEFQLEKGMYVIVPSDDGEIIATVSDVYKTNRYFSSPSAVRAYETSGKTLASIFPADRWEHIIAKAKPLGIITDIGIQRLLFPVSPGETVFIPESEVLQKFLGLEKTKGINLGKIEQHDVEVQLNLTRFLQKHAAILAISGAGKSYTVSVMLEELLSRQKKQGRIAMVLFDVHGEYKGLGDEESPFYKHVEIFPAAAIQFGTNVLRARQFAIFEPQITSVQTRELSKILYKLFEEKTKKDETYKISDIVKELEEDEKINQRSKEALIGWLYTLDETRLFGASEYPILEKILEPGKLVIFDLSEFT
ncbi:MAG: ATP-binding protein, partial [Candidatus Heimdallarchaeaceae archaeon]